MKFVYACLTFAISISASVASAAEALLQKNVAYTVTERYCADKSEPKDQPSSFTVDKVSVKFTDDGKMIFTHKDYPNDELVTSYRIDGEKLYNVHLGNGQEMESVLKVSDASSFTMVTSLSANPIEAAKVCSSGAFLYTVYSIKNP